MEEEIRVNFLGLQRVEQFNRSFDVLCLWEALSRRPLGIVEGTRALELGILGLVPFAPPLELIAVGVNLSESASSLVKWE